MAIANYFYNKTTRKYVALFGTYFNQITIERDDNENQTLQKMIVPISYAPYQKILARIQQDPKLNRKQAISLPRMSFDLSAMSYDSSRKISPVKKILLKGDQNDSSSRSYRFVGTPYNLEFSLYIMAKYNEDAVKIVEQIIPFFTPEFTNTVKLVDNIDPIDVPLVLNSITNDEVYEGDFSERSSVMWTLSFTMKCWYFGPEKNKKVIKFVDINYATDTSANTAFEEQQEARPGLTAEGEPTVVLENSVDTVFIEYDDPWDLINNIRSVGVEID